MKVPLILMSLLAGIHPVKEALKAGLPLDRVIIARGAGGTRLQELIDLCRERQVPVRFEPRAQLDRAASGGHHQGVIAFGAEARYATIQETAAGRGLHVVLDGIEDPHNLGAIVRTAHAAGAAAVVIPERRAAGLTDTVARSAAGALAHIPVVRAGNINRALEQLKELGYWIYGLDERGPLEYRSHYLFRAHRVRDRRGRPRLARSDCQALRFPGAHSDAPGRSGIAQRERSRGGGAVRMAPKISRGCT